MKRTTYVGIDYSLTSPCVAVYDRNTGEFCFQNVDFYFLTDKKSMAKDWDNIHGSLFPTHACEQERHYRNAVWATSKFQVRNDLVLVGIEDYAFSAKGKVFNLAENCGELKQHLWDAKMEFRTYIPSTIKKFATGKGNAKKEDMLAAFIKETNIDLKAVLQPNAKLGNPTTDIIDAYYILKYAYTQDNLNT